MGKLNLKMLIPISPIMPVQHVVRRDKYWEEKKEAL